MLLTFLLHKHPAKTKLSGVRVGLVRAAFGYGIENLSPHDLRVCVLPNVCHCRKRRTLVLIPTAFELQQEWRCNTTLLSHVEVIRDNRSWESQRRRQTTFFIVHCTTFSFLSTSIDSGSYPIWLLLLAIKLAPRATNNRSDPSCKNDQKFLHRFAQFGLLPVSFVYPFTPFS